DAPAELTGGRRDRDDHLFGTELVEDLADLAGGAEHVDAVQAHAALAGVVIEKADRPRPEVGVELELARDHLAARAGADDEDLTRAANVPAGEPLDQHHSHE